jgi:hypothetical protein
MRLRRAWFGVGIATCFAASPARAFERQWHFGGGFGMASPTGIADLGPALSLYGAYGLSDVFDLRLELQGSNHDYSQGRLSFMQARGGIAYKIDVIQWIPYVGVSAGSCLVTWPLGTGTAPSFGGFGGLDYAFSRHVGLGMFVAADYVLFNPTQFVASGFVRGEYRFGW